MSNREKLLQEAKKSIGLEVSPQDIAPDELACAESACNVIRKVFRDFPVLTYTPRLHEELKRDKRFKGTLDLEPGNIIISPTEYGSGIFPGHVGIILEDGKIASNTSRNGLWEANYTINTWVDRYRNKGGFPIFFHTPIENEVDITNL